MPGLGKGRIPAAIRIERIAGQLLGVPLPVRLLARDGSAAGPPDGPAMVLRRRALRHFLWSPGELGLARAFVSEQLRVWRLYLAGGQLAFEENRMGVNQIQAVRPDANGGTS